MFIEENLKAHWVSFWHEDHKDFLAVRISTRVIYGVSSIDLTLILNPKARYFLGFDIYQCLRQTEKALVFSSEVMHGKSCNSKGVVELSIFQQIQG